MTTDASTQALAALHAGLCVLPPREDGSKAPDADSWTDYQKRQSTEAEVRDWYANGRTGLGVVCGAVSGGLELLDFDEREAFDKFDALARASGLGDLFERVKAGYLEETPSGGMHTFWYCDTPRSAKLARRPKRADEKRDPHDRIKTMIETKGEGGYSVTAPSSGRVHETGRPYVLLRGGFDSIVRVTPEERDALLGLARMLDRMPRREPGREEPRGSRSDGELRPGDDFNCRATWAEVLEPHGWVRLYETGGETYWRRPGKPQGISATTNYRGSGLLYVFSSSTPFETERGYDLFGAFAVLNHGGDLAAAARALAARGFGTPRTASTSGGPRGGAEARDPSADESERGEPAELPLIQLTDRQLDAVLDDAVRVVVAANEPPQMFLRGGVVVSIRRDEEDRPVVAPITETALVDRLASAARWVRGTVERPRDAGPNRELASVVLERLTRSASKLPPLRGVTESPLMRRDGSILDRPGYDRATRLYFAPTHGLELGAVPDAPSAEQVRAAFKLLDEELFLDFPFAGDADLATAIAALLTLVLRELIVGCVPLFLFDAPAPGSGKGLLADAIGTTATGAPAAKMPEPDGRGDDEWRKRLTALLLEGRAVAVLDNLERPLGSASLATALTTEQWSDRFLGSTRMLTIPNRAVFIATGNNLRLRGDLPRRCVWSRLDAKEAQPWTREGFRHPDLLKWVREHRGELLTALFTLARAWIAAGRPAPDGVPCLGSFEGWRHTIGGILGVANVPAFLGNAEQLYSTADEDTPAWAGFLAAWRDAFGPDQVTVAQLLERVKHNALAPLAEALPGELAEALEKKSVAKLFGRALARKAETRFTLDDGATVRLVRAGLDSHAGVVRWLVSEG